MQRHRFPAMAWALRCWHGIAGPRKPSNDVPPFPYRQFIILALVRICEPIAFMSVFPYVYYMVESFHVTDNDQKIAVFAGMITSAFTFAEFSSGLFWGRLSDRIGRKPVLIMGLLGTAISMLVFGFAPNLTTAMIARALGGLLNGNIGVLQTTVAEIVTVKAHQPRAYSIMPFVWCLGSILGPMMGGALARPVLSYPTLFKPGSIFDRFPFLLPNLVCVVILIFGILIGVLFLEETHSQKKYRRDRGLEVGQWLLARFSQGPPTLELSDDKAALLQEESYLAEDDPPPVYRSREPSPRSSSVGDAPPVGLDTDIEQPRRSPSIGFSRAFTRQVILNIIGYGILAFHSVSFDQLMPIFLSTPKSDEPVSLPFHFTGGLSLSTKSIGFMLSIQGIYSMFAQIWLFPYAVRRLGALRVFRIVLLVWPPLYVAVPYLVLLPAWLQIPAVYVALLGKITLHVIAFPATALLLANAIPSKDVLGSVNGVASSVASLSRALGPTITGFLHSKGLHSGTSVIAWWAIAIVATMGGLESLLMEEVDVPSPDVPDAADGGQQEPSRKSPSTQETNEAPEEAVGLLSADTMSDNRDSDEPGDNKLLRG